MSLLPRFSSAGLLRDQMQLKSVDSFAFEQRDNAMFELTQIARAQYESCHEQKSMHGGSVAGSIRHVM